MKKEIASAPVIAYYNPKKQTVLQTDASIKHLGAYMLEDEKPVYFASKALTDTPKRVHCHRIRIINCYMGQEEIALFLVCNPLHLRNRSEASEGISSKSINQATPRLQEILIRTFPCHFTVHYIPGLTNQLADCLS